MVIGPGPAGLKFWSQPAEQVTEIYGPLGATEDTGTLSMTAEVLWLAALVVGEASDTVNMSGTVAGITAGKTSVKVGGAWVPADTFVKTGGVWLPATTYVKDAGTWKAVA